MKQSARPVALAVLPLIILSQLAVGQDAKQLPGTKLLTISEPLDEVMVAGISRFALRALQNSPQQRDKHWTRDYSSPIAYAKSIEPNRTHLRTIIGAADPRDKANGFELVAK